MRRASSVSAIFAGRTKTCGGEQELALGFALGQQRAGEGKREFDQSLIRAKSSSKKNSRVVLALLYLLADNKTKRHFRDRHEAIDDESDAYCWRRSGFFWRMRASFGLACAQATTLAAQVFGKDNPRSRAGRSRA